MRRVERQPARDAARFKATVARCAARIGVRPKRIQLQRMTTKWASCSSAGRLCFSQDLPRKARMFQEVVVVHELLHLLVPNHGKLFKSLLTAYVPGWQQVSGNQRLESCSTRRNR